MPPLVAAHRVSLDARLLKVSIVREVRRGGRPVLRWEIREHSVCLHDYFVESLRLRLREVLGGF